MTNTSKYPENPEVILFWYKGLIAVTYDGRLTRQPIDRLGRRHRWILEVDRP